MQNMIETDKLIGKSIVSGNSSLRNFALALNDGNGISLEAVDADGNPSISSSIVAAGDLPALNEAVCSVDWSWICGSVIKQISSSDKALRLQLDPAGPLTVSVGVWQGSPFLSFQPFRPAKE